jgi:hypothetical protein
MADNHCVKLDCENDDFIIATFLMCSHQYAFCYTHGLEFYNYLRQGLQGACPTCDTPFIPPMVNLEQVA